LFAGKREIGTKISVMFLNELKIEEKEKEVYLILEGKDYDGDGKIDKIEVIERNIL